VTSKIASLWKKVEDSKKQKKDTSKDKRVWISKGKVQDSSPAVATPTPGRLIRSGTYEKINESDSIVPDFKEPKPRSRSRLSMKLSKFSLKRGKGSSVEDQVNGNTTPVSPDDEMLGNHSVNSISPTEERLHTPTDDLPLEAARSDESSESMSTGPDSFDRTLRNTYTTNTTGLDKFKNAQIKRNSSYVSSMGRKQEEERRQQAEQQQQQQQQQPYTSSSVVTLV